MVMSEEDDVEARHLACHPFRCILLDAVVSRDASFTSAVEESQNEVGMFHLFNIFHPLACRLDHLLKCQSFPQTLVQPQGDGGCEQAQYGNLHAVTHDDGVGEHVGTSCLGVNDIGTQHRTLHILNPFVIDGMSCFHIVVAEGLCVVVHVVDYLCRNVGFVAGHVVRPVA